MQEKALLQQAMKNKQMTVLYRDTLGAREYAGIPVSVENELVVLHRESNFSLDGYTALRTGDVTETEQMDDVPFLKKVLSGEGVYEAVKVPAFPCPNWRALLEGIRKQFGGWAAVECENPDEPLYFVGRVQQVDDRYLVLRRVDGLGNWLPDLLTLPLDDITVVSFGDRYLEMFRKYCKG